MSLVTLIQSADTSIRSAVVQVEDWALPKEAVFTGKLDEAGRKIYSVVEADVAAVKAEVPVVSNTANGVVSTLEADLKKVEEEVEKLGSEAKAKVKAAVAAVEKKL